MPFDYLDYVLFDCLDYEPFDCFEYEPFDCLEYEPFDCPDYVLRLQFDRLPCSISAQPAAHDKGGE